MKIKMKQHEFDNTQTGIKQACHPERRVQRGVDRVPP